MKVSRLLILLIALVIAPPPTSIYPEVPDFPKKVPIRRLPGHLERKKQAEAERRAAERGEIVQPEPALSPTPRAPVSSLSFAGMDFDDSNPSDPLHGSVPPDTHAATGPDHIVETVNTAFSIYTRSDGTKISGPNDLNAFFGVSSNHSLGDPVVLYDELAARFFIGVIDFGTDTSPSSDLLYAVSGDSAPTGPGSFSQQSTIHLRHNGKFSCNGSVDGDFPRAGWNADAHVFTFNMFDFATNCFDGVQIVVIDKSGINPPIAIDRSGASNFTLTPAVMHNSVHDDPMWFVQSFFVNTITVVEMTDVLGASGGPTFHPHNIPVASFTEPPNATQKGGGFTLDTGDSRILNAEWRDDHLVATHTIGSSGLAKARWYEFATGGASPTLTQQGTITQGSAHTYYPSIAIAANGDLGLTFMESSSKEFVSMYVTGRSVGDLPGTMQTPVLIKAGERNYVSFDCADAHECRAGDFSGITADPGATDTFCAANEYATSLRATENWGTWLTCFKLMPIHDFAVTAIKAPKSLSGAGVGPVVGAVTVTIQNRSDHPETITQADLNNGLVTLSVVSADEENCSPGVVVLDPVKTPALFSKGPKILKLGGTLTVAFQVTYNCANPLPKGGDLTPGDYSHTATVHHDALPGALADTHPDDDMCPRIPLPFDSNPPPKGTVDKGCGAKTPTGTLGGPVVTNIVL